VVREPPVGNLLRHTQGRMRPMAQVRAFNTNAYSDFESTGSPGLVFQLRAKPRAAGSCQC